MEKRTVAEDMLQKNVTRCGVRESVARFNNVRGVVDGTCVHIARRHTLGTNMYSRNSIIKEGVGQKLHY